MTTPKLPRDDDERVVAHLLLPPGPVCRAIREEAGLSQAALAGRAGTTAPTISRYETGTRSKPRGRVLIAYYREICRLRELIEISSVVGDQ